MTQLELANLFHETLAPDFNHELRTETRHFAAESPDGRIMVAVCVEILSRFAITPTGTPSWLEGHERRGPWLEMEHG